MKYSSFKIEKKISTYTSRNKSKNVETICYYLLKNRKNENIAQVRVDYYSSNEDEAELRDLHVEQKYRKNGLATRLMFYVIEKHGHQIIKLTPFDEEDLGIDLRTFYEKFGFVGEAGSEYMYRSPTKQKGKNNEDHS